MDRQTIFYNFVTLLVVLDPVGTSTVFGALTVNLEPRHRRQMAQRATLLAGIILFVFAFAGEHLMVALGIRLAAFRIAGGLMLFLLAIDMVFARPSGLRSVSPLENVESEQRRDLTVFPLAFPLIAGPGAMTTVVLLMGRAQGEPLKVASVLGVLLLVLALVLSALLAASVVRRVLGVTGSNVIGRLMGIVLAALAVEFVLDGLQAVFSS
jgi:multiple antibiotic resistance protein